MMTVYYEVEWIDTSGHGHSVQFGENDMECLKELVELLSRVSMMLHTYKITKEELPL